MAKKCSYCSREYSDDIAVCAIDGEQLRNLDVPQAIVLTQPASTRAESLETVTQGWTERQLLIIEVVLVCLLAFGVSVLSSFRALQLTKSAGGYTSAFSWSYAFVRQGAVIGIVWYI